MSERRIVTKVEYDTSGAVEGNARLQASISSTGETARQTARKQEEAIRKTEREYQRLVERLDPVVKAERQYADAVDVATRALAAGAITEAEHGRALELAERQLKSTSGAATHWSTALKNVAQTGAAATYVAVQLRGHWGLLSAAGRLLTGQATGSAAAMTLLRGGLASVAGVAGPVALGLGAVAAALIGLKVAKEVSERLAGVAAKAIEVGGAYQQLREQLVTVTGSEEAAAVAFKRLQDFSQRSPDELDAVTQAYIRLVDLGIDPSAERMEAFGNVAAGKSKTLIQFAEAVADATTGEFERLKEFGIKASKEGENVAFTFRGVTTTVKADAESISAYLEKIGRVDYAGAMERQAATAKGAASMLADAWSRTYDRLFTLGLGDLYTEWTRTQTVLVSAIEKVDPALSRAEAGFTSLGDAVFVSRKLLEGEILIVSNFVNELAAANRAFGDVFGQDFRQILARAAGWLREQEEIRRKSEQAAEQVATNAARHGVTMPHPEGRNPGRDAEEDYNRWLAGEYTKQNEARRRQAQQLADEQQRQAEQLREKYRELNLELKQQEQHWRLIRDGIPKDRADAILAAGKLLGTELLNQDGTLRSTVEQWAGVLLRMERAVDQARTLDGVLKDTAKSAGDIEVVDKVGLSDQPKEGAKEFLAEWQTAWQRYEVYAQDAIDSTADAIKAGIFGAIRDGSVEWEDLWGSLMDRLLATFLDMLEAMVRRWLAAQATMAATDYASKSGEAKGGGGKDFLGSGMGMLGGGGGGGGGFAWSGGYGGGFANGLGGGAGSGLAGAGIFAAVAAILINQANTSGRSHARSTVLGPDTGSWNNNGQGGNWEQTFRAAQDIIRRTAEFIRAIGGDIGDLTKATPLTVGKIGQGKKQQWYVEYANGLVRNFGNDFDAAMDFAMVQAIRQAPARFMTPEVRTALQNSTAETMEALTANIATAMTVATARLGELGAQVVEIFQRRAEEIRAARALGLATDDLTNARDRELVSLRNQALGINDSAARALAALGSLNAGLSDVATHARTAAEQQVAAARAGLEALGTGPSGQQIELPSGRSVVQTQEMWERARAELQRQLDRYLAELDRLPQALSNDELNMGVFGILFAGIEGNRKLERKYEEDRIKYARMKVEIEFEAIRLQLIALGKWEEFAGMFNDVLNAAREEAGKPVRGGGGGGGQREGVRDFIADRRFQLGLEGKGAHEREMAELRRGYDDWLEQAGKDKKLKQELLALLEQEEAILRERALRATGVSHREYTQGPNVFNAERERFNALRAQWKDLLDAGTLKWRDYRAKVDEANAALGRHLETLARQEESALAGQLAGLFDAAGIDDAVLKEELLHAQRTANFILAREEANIRYATLVAENRLSAETMRIFERAMGIINGINPEAIAPPGGPPLDGGGDWRREARESAARELERSQEEAARIREKYRAEREDEFTRRVRAIEEDFGKVFAVFGRVPETLAEFRRAVEDAFADLSKPVDDWLARFDLSPQSALTGQQRLDEATRQLDALFARLKGGDFSAYAEFGGLADQALDLAGGQYGTAGGAYGLISERVKAMAQQAKAIARAGAVNFVDTGTLGPGNVSLFPLAVQESIIAAANHGRQAAVALAQSVTLQTQSVTTLGEIRATLITLADAQAATARSISMANNSRPVQR